MYSDPRQRGIAVWLISARDQEEQRRRIFSAPDLMTNDGYGRPIK